MPVSRFLIPLVSTVWIFSVMGGMGMHVLAEHRRVLFSCILLRR